MITIQQVDIITAAELDSWNYENKYSYVTFVYDHKQFGAHKGCNHPKHYRNRFGKKICKKRFLKTSS